jgi:hypothetical protein
MIRWPVEDTGRNSVRPSTMPRMMAFRYVVMLVWGWNVKKNLLRARGGGGQERLARRV